jgi:hypothetical protein
MNKPIEAPDLSLVEHEVVAPDRRSPPAYEQLPVVFPPMVRTRSNAMPYYVEHREGATEIGKLSAEAIVGEYETAAQEIEGMGAHFVIEEMKATAARYREEAKRVFLQIENCMLMTAEVRKTCIEFKEKIAVTPAATG